MIALLLVVAKIGLADPFAPPPDAAQRENAEGFRLLRQKSLAAARPHFLKALASSPEYDAARFNLATTYAIEGKWASALKELGPVLEHNYARYAKQVLSDPDWAPVKVASEKEALRVRLEKARAAYVLGLDRTLLLIARSRAPIESPNGEQVRTFHHQEVYAYDLGSGRYRQLTETAGRTVAFVRAPDGKHIAYVTQEKSVVVGGVYGRVMQDAQVAELDLVKLDGKPPIALPTDTLAASVTYVKGDLKVSFATPKKTDEPVLFESPGELVVVHPGQVDYYPPQGSALTGRLGIPIDPVSVAWSPMHRMALFRRHVPPCALEKQRGELYLYEVAKRRTTRIASARALFDAIWLAEDTFAFEDGLGDKAAIRLRRGRKMTTLKMLHGAGLRAVPELPSCSS